LSSLLVLAAAVVVAVGLVRFGDRLDPHWGGHETIAWCAAGAVWWILLSPSALGLLLLLVALALAIRGRTIRAASALPHS
jgi:hypothetical protein